VKSKGSDSPEAAKIIAIAEAKLQKLKSEVELPNESSGTHNRSSSDEPGIELPNRRRDPDPDPDDREVKTLIDGSDDIKSQKATLVDNPTIANLDALVAALYPGPDDNAVLRTVDIPPMTDAVLIRIFAEKGIHRMQTVGDGDCGVHALFIAVSPKFRLLTEKHKKQFVKYARRVLLPEMFSKPGRPSRPDLINDIKKTVDEPTRPGQIYYLRDPDIGLLCQLFNIRGIVFAAKSTSLMNDAGEAAENTPYYMMYADIANRHYEALRIGDDQYSLPKTDAKEIVESLYTASASAPGSGSGPGPAPVPPGPGPGLGSGPRPVPVLPKARKVIKAKAKPLSPEEIESNEGVVRGDENQKQTVRAKREVNKGRKTRNARKQGGTRKLRKQFELK